MNFIKNIFSSAYEELWKAIIRPNRDNYSDMDLGQEKFELRNKWYKRTDLTIINKRNHKLACSFWEPFDEEREFPQLPCVIYLHGNSSSRCEVIPEIKYLLSRNITVFSFDFSGCGRSEGDYISLGYYEQDDVECIVNFLRKSNKVSSIGLWGRSMGAVTALMYGSKDLSIAGLVLDSPFSSLKVLIDELARERVALPEFIVKQAIKLIKEIIKDKANFNIDDIELKDYAKKCFIPAFFCHAKGDSFVNIHHCKDLYNVYAGDKNIVYVKGDHNTERPIHFKDSVAVFFYKSLRCRPLNQRYLSQNFRNLNFNFKNYLYYDSNLINHYNEPSKNKLNNTISEIKKSLKGKYNRNFYNFENYKNDDESYLIQNYNDITLKSADDISVNNTIEFPKMRINNNYIKDIINVNKSVTIPDKNKNLFGPSFQSYFLNKTPSKLIVDDDIILKNETENKEQNDKDEEILQKILQLSKKEFEEISTNTPNFINFKINNNKKDKRKLCHKKCDTCDINKIKSNKNTIFSFKKKIPDLTKICNLKSKNSLILPKNFDNKNNNKTNLNCLYKNSPKIRNSENNFKKLSKKNTTGIYNNKTYKNIKHTLRRNSKYLKNTFTNNKKPFPPKLSFSDLVLKIKKNDKNELKKKKINDFNKNINNIINNITKNNKNNNNNIYKNNKNSNYNNISKNNRNNNKNINNNINYKIKNNLKVKNNIKKEENKNFIRNKRKEKILKVLDSSPNKHLQSNIYKFKKRQYINNTNNSSINNIVINNKIKKSESSIDNDSETINNSHLDNKINGASIYLEDDDNFFLEEDNIEINIPH